jgi:hypothetical protein
LEEGAFSDTAFLKHITSKDNEIRISSCFDSLRQGLSLEGRIENILGMGVIRVIRTPTQYSERTLNVK